MSKIDGYIKKQPKEVQVILKRIKRVIRSVAPRATESISYGIPTFDLEGVHLIHFAAFKNHISLFPTSSGIKRFKSALAKYKTSKGTVQFRLDTRIPYTLIKRIAAFRVKEVRQAES